MKPNATALDQALLAADSADADALVTGSYTKQGNLWSLQAQVYHRRAGQRAKQDIRISGDSVYNLLDEFPKQLLMQSTGTSSVALTTTSWKAKERGIKMPDIIIETVIPNEKLKLILTELRHRFEQLYGERLARMVLYGSQARGDPEPDSDIDLLVVLKGQVSPCDEINRTLKDVADISLKYNEVIACVFVSEAEFERERSPLMLNVHREGLSV